VPVHREFTADDAWLLAAGSHTRLWEVLGAHPAAGGTSFRVWAPNAEAVSVIGDLNGWNPAAHPLTPDPSGVWRGVAPFGAADRYKYRVVGRGGRYRADKADPCGFWCEEPPLTASRVWAADHEWGDGDWMGRRGEANRHDRPISIYEVHLGSWRYEPGGYRALARQLAAYCTELGFTHVELLPVMEHPFRGSWGYQTTGYFAPTARFGAPEEFMAFVDTLHQAGIGVLLDWVPSHFPSDEHGLGYFDGTHLFEHADPRLGYHPDWNSLIFNYDRAEVRSFLLSSAHYWLDVFHADGLRVDAVASMLYLDYSRKEGEWIPNRFGGKENLGAIAFLQELNRSIYAAFPDALMVAEESTAWPGVTRAVHDGGLGFGFKWDMGWMHDTLRYVSRLPVHRRYHHDELTFRSVYATSEEYVLPLSHDEVVHGKGSLLGKLPGDAWQRLAGLRLLLAYQWTTPGKKLLFMGGEFGQRAEWNHEQELDWGLLVDAGHAGVQALVARLNELLRSEPALYERDGESDGFTWLVGDDREQSTYVFGRSAPSGRPLVVIANFTPIPRYGYVVGVPEAGEWEELLNTDAAAFGGSGVASGAGSAAPVAAHGQTHSLTIGIPPLALVVLAARRTGGAQEPAAEHVEQVVEGLGAEERGLVARDVVGE
jgi:1,4-alpha-glucan branching enzyme